MKHELFGSMSSHHRQCGVMNAEMFSVQVTAMRAFVIATPGFKGEIVPRLVERDISSIQCAINIHVFLPIGSAV